MPEIKRHGKGRYVNNAQFWHQSNFNHISVSTWSFNPRLVSYQTNIFLSRLNWKSFRIKQHLFVSFILISLLECVKLDDKWPVVDFVLHDRLCMQNKFGKKKESFLAKGGLTLDQKLQQISSLLTTDQTRFKLHDGKQKHMYLLFKVFSKCQ